jgi:hypothetical protein
VSNTTRTTWVSYSPNVGSSQAYDAELEPYVSLFVKPLSSKKSRFTKSELEGMCKDPRHSPQLIRYLIDVIKRM